MALVHHWRLDEENATDVAVDSVGGVDLTPKSGSEPAVVADARFGHVRSWGNVGGSQRTLIATGTVGSSGGNGTIEQFVAGAQPLNVNFIGAEWSLSWWMRVTGNITASAGLFYVGKPDNQACTHEAPATVHASGHVHSYRIGHLNAHVDTSETGQWRWSYASGAQRSGNNGSNPYPQYSVWMHHALIRRGDNVEFWCNGALLNSSAWTSEPYTPQDNYDDPGFAPGPEVFWIGSSTLSNTLNQFYNASWVDLAHVRIYDHALTEAEVIDLAAPETDPDTTAPVISNVTPAAGTPMGRHDAWAFRVTDNVGFRRTMVWATLKDSRGNERGKEVIWDGSDFSTAWSAGTRTEVTAGKVYDFASIRRNGGIPHHITDVVFDVAAIDTSGNEGT